MCFFKEQKSAFFQKKTKDPDLKRNEKTQVGSDFLKIWFFSNLVISEYFFVIFPWSHDLEQVASPPVWLGVRRTPRSVGPWY